MRKMFAIVAAVAMMGAVGGCKKKDDKKKQDKPAAKVPTQPKPAPTPTPKPADDAPEMVNKMANCPNAVKGSETKIEATDKAVVVTVTAKDKAATDDIRKRAKALAAVQGATSDKVKHTGKGTGGGRLGACPVVMADTKIEVADVDGGSKITVTPTDASKLAALKADAEARHKKLAAGEVKMGGHGSGTGGGSGGGGGEGGHGSGTGGGNSGGGGNK